MFGNLVSNLKQKLTGFYQSYNTASDRKFCDQVGAALRAHNFNDKMIDKILKNLEQNLRVLMFEMDSSRKNSRALYFTFYELLKNEDFSSKRENLPVINIDQHSIISSLIVISKADDIEKMTRADMQHRVILSDIKLIGHFFNRSIVHKLYSIRVFTNDNRRHRQNYHIHSAQRLIRLLIHSMSCALYEDYTELVNFEDLRTLSRAILGAKVEDLVKYAKAQNISLPDNPEYYSSVLNAMKSMLNLINSMRKKERISCIISHRRYNDLSIGSGMKIEEIEQLIPNMRNYMNNIRVMLSRES